MPLLLYAVFIASGAAGLIYESIWSRYLGLFVGHSAYAQIIVLVIFLGGMSLGAALVSRRSERVRQPLFWYAVVELACGVVGLLFHDVYGAVTGWAYGSVFPSLGSPAAVTLVKWALAALLILPQSILLGTTFPLMSAGVLRLVRGRGDDRAGRVLSLLYFANSLGAAAGVLVAGFVLVALAGLPGTLLAAAMLNLLVAAVVIVALRVHRDVEPEDAMGIDPHGVTGREPGDLVPAAHATGTAPISPPELARLSRVMLGLAFGTAAASFVYEIAWVRMLSLVLGSATHSFELMLSAFILGLALGAFWVRSRADRFSDPVRVLGVVQVAMGGLAVATMPIYLASFEWQAALLAGITPSPSGWRLFTVAKYAVSLLVMLPATFCAGITLPLMTRVLLSAGAGERAIGTVYAVNTLGSIIGAALAGLVLLPLLGLKWLQVTGAGVDVALGLALLAGVAGTARAASAHSPPPLRTRPPVRPLLLAAVAGGASLVAVITTVRFDTLLLSSGVYRDGRLRRAAEGWETTYYADGRTATVSALRNPRLGAVLLLTNGKPDASLQSAWLKPFTGTEPNTGVARDQAAQVLLPLLTLAYHPRAAAVANIGQGSGISGHMLLGAPSVTAVTTIEIEPRMIDGSRVFLPANRRLFDDPRHRFVIDDAKSVFAASRERFDLILSEPSNPWVSGVANLFTDEFYQRVQASLGDDGVLGQWMHTYETSDALVLSILAAVHRNFPHYVVHATSDADLLIIASRRPLVNPDWSVVRAEGIAEDLRRNFPLTPEALEATRLADRSVLTPLLDSWASVNSDFYPVVDLGAERARFLRTRATGFTGLATGRFDVGSLLAGTTRPLPATWRVPAEMPRLVRAAFAQRVRAAVTGAAVADAAVPAVPGDTLQRVLFERVGLSAWEAQQFEAVLATGAPPADWTGWAATFGRVEEVWHGASLGQVDEAWYARVGRYLERASAPAGARSVVELHHALGTLDFTRAAAAAQILEAEWRAGRRWVEAEVLRHGGVVARLRTGDVLGAARLLESTTPPSLAEDARVLLLQAWVRAASQTAATR